MIYIFSRLFFVEKRGNLIFIKLAASAATTTL